MANNESKSERGGRGKEHAEASGEGPSVFMTVADREREGAKEQNSKRRAL